MMEKARQEQELRREGMRKWREASNLVKDAVNGNPEEAPSKLRRARELRKQGKKLVEEAGKLEEAASMEIGRLEILMRGISPEEEARLASAVSKVREGRGLQGKGFRKEGKAEDLKKIVTMCEPEEAVSKIRKLQKLKRQAAILFEKADELEKAGKLEVLGNGTSSEEEEEEGENPEVSQRRKNKRQKRWSKLVGCYGTNYEYY